MNTPKAPWLKYFGDMPAHLDYPTGSMYEAVKESAKTKKKMNIILLSLALSDLILMFVGLSEIMNSTL